MGEVARRMNREEWWATFELLLKKYPWGDAVLPGEELSPDVEIRFKARLQITVQKREPRGKDEGWEDLVVDGSSPSGRS